MLPLPVYVVTLSTPHGVGALEVPSLLGPDAASRRAVLSACALGWGDLDSISVDSVAPLNA